MLLVQVFYRFVNIIEYRFFQLQQMEKKCDFDSVTLIQITKTMQIEHCQYLILNSFRLQLDSLKHKMAYNPIHKIPLQQIQYEYNHFNPITLHLKKTNHKSKNPPTTHYLHPHTQKQVRFRDLSKEKPNYYSHFQNKQNNNKCNQIIHKESMGEFAKIRRKLQFDNNNSTSKSRDKSMSFSDVIRMSRQKKLREESSSKYSKVIKQSSKNQGGGKVFNALKNRLIGQNQSNKSSLIPTKPQQQSKPIKQTIQMCDMVRVSTQFEPTLLSQSLSMAPNI